MKFFLFYIFVSYFMLLLFSRSLTSEYLLNKTILRNKFDLVVAILKYRAHKERTSRARDNFPLRIFDLMFSRSGWKKGGGAKEVAGQLPDLLGRHIECR